MKNIYRLFILSMLVFGASCGDEFLEQRPRTEPEAGDFISNEVNLVSLIQAAYQPMRWEFDPIYGDSYCMSYIYTDVRSDDVIIENKFFQPHSHGFENFVDMTTSNINVRLIWTKLFTGVANANEIIQGLLNSTSVEIDQTTLDAYLAEARFLRAYYYFELVKNYGEVPLFGDDPVNLANPDDIRRKSVEEIYAQIESDLMVASEDLASNPPEAFRASQGAAMALLSKVYLYQEKWQEAADAAQAVIDLGVYSLEENFGDNWDIENEHGVESIFEIAYFNSTAGGTWNRSAQTSLTVQFFSPPFSNTPLVGWSYNLTSPDLLAAFQAEGDTERLNATILTEGLDVDSDILVTEGLSPIPANFFDEWINSAESNGLQYGDDFSYSMKYFLTPEEIETFTPGLQQSTLNQKVLRYAEVLLILAEAVVNGASGDGQGAFDQVRARAGLASKPLTLDALKLERRLELATEWNRFHDLVRWGDAASTLDNFTVGKDELLPIPLEEILATGTDSNGDFIITQNNGY